ncbi:ABC transporter substrate-binding protein [Silicimonas sp. MF1-12-2]|uniref:ABC transporter substrate-binding protein n=1 Tax=Silicimonas sp. MF1-12-2 TaxID=3384793 RepID=UPI0039B4B698
MKRILLSGAAMVVLPGMALANCPGITVADMGGVAAGAFPQQYELAEFQSAAGCTMEFSGNPDAGALNGRIKGNGDLPALADRLPAEPLVVVPYESVGKYGGTLDALSNATEAGTSDFLSTRHVNLVRYADDLQTIVPNVAKSWSWNDDFTQLTFTLRAGHKWSDGAPFTSADVKFWHDNIMLDSNINETPKDYVLVGGEQMTVDTPDDVTVVFNLPAPKPGLLAHFATSYAQGFQPKHFLGQFHPGVNPDADSYAQSLGFENGYDAILAYYGNSDWTDTPSPLLSRPAIVDGLPKAVVPTLESFLTVSDTTEGRHYVANPYFFMVDTTGQQLPYISEQDELYKNDNEVRILSVINGEVDYKAQSLQLASAPLLLENQEKGNYTVQLNPDIAFPTLSFNVTSEDMAKRELFGNVEFRRAMSVAIDRDQINEVAYFGQGRPLQYNGFSPLPDFMPAELETAYAQYDPAMANAMLDEVGMVDTDGDGMRELPNGDKFVLNLQFATQGAPGELAQLVAQNWTDVGVETTVKEVTPDEYRSAQSANQLDVMIWRKGQPLALHLGDNTYWVPPFDGYFDIRTGMLWAEYLESGGASGVEPPAWVNEMIADVNAFQSAPIGSDEQKALATKLAQKMVDEMLFIGTVLAPAPLIHNNDLKNFTQFKTTSYEYYRTFPYLPAQWWLDE